jgi:hypothetical protein
MVFASHTVIGLAVSSLLPPGPWQAASAFGVSLLGHYLSDAIPHWQYSPGFIIDDPRNKMNTRMIGGRRFWLGSGLILLDLCLGVMIGLLLFSRSGLSAAAVLLSILGSIIPDLLQPLYFIYRKEPWTTIQRIHHFFHRFDHINDPRRGIAAQIIAVAAVVAIAKLVG